jgi:hypothetical protein
MRPSRFALRAIPGNNPISTPADGAAFPCGKSGTSPSRTEGSIPSPTRRMYSAYGRDVDHHEAAYSPSVLKLEHVSTTPIASMPPPRLPVVSPLLPQGGIDKSRLRIQSPSRQKETLHVAVRFERYGRRLPHNAGVELVLHPKQLVWLLKLILQCQNLHLHCIANPYERLLGF